MCGRKFNLPTLSWDVYQSNFTLTTQAPQTNFAPNYNIAPTHEVPVIFNEDGERYLSPMRWGLIPAWSKTLKLQFSTFNATAEKVEDSSLYALALKSRCCIVPISRFYEWKRYSKVDNQAYAICNKDRPPFLMAGLWARNRQIDPEHPVESYTIMTSEPNDLVSNLHNRMPAILSVEQIDTWLDADWDEARDCLKDPYPSINMEAYKVSNEVGKVSNNYESLAHPVA